MTIGFEIEDVEKTIEVQPEGNNNPEPKELIGEKMQGAREQKKVNKYMKEIDILRETIERKAAPKRVAGKDNDNIWFSNEVDINQHGVPSSDFPAWYFDQHIDELKIEIDSLEKNLALDLYRGAHLTKVRKDLVSKKVRLENILESKPDFDDKTKDKMAKAVKFLGERIGHVMISRDAKNKRLADAHYEVEKMMRPSVDVGSEVEADFYKRKGVQIINGRVSRLQAEICWKIMKKALDGGIANTEALRPAR